MKAIGTFVTLCFINSCLYFVYSQQNCDRVKQLYLFDKNYVIPDSEGSDSSNSLICKQSDSCCNDFESLLKSRATNDLKSMISSVIVPLNTIVNSSQTQIKQLLERILNETHNRTNTKFDDYRLKEASSRLFTHLWSVVVDGVPQRRVEQYVNRLFNALYVVEYEKEKRKQFSGEFASCLSSLWTEYSAFDHVPQTMSFRIQRAVESSSLLLRSLMLSSEVINATKYYNPSEKCLEGLVKASYCSHCSGHLNARPCRPFCQNVIRSCLSELSRLDIEWQRFTNSWQHFSASLVADKNPQTVFMSIDSLIDEAIRSLKSKTHETAKKVKVACGHPKRYLRNVVTNSNTPSAMTTTTTDTSTSLFVRLQTSAHQLSKTKEFFSSLSEVICNEYSDDNCWNGDSIGQYTQPLVPFGAETRRFNSTLAQNPENTTISSLSDKLKKITLIMESYVTPHALSSDEYLMDEDSSGSGHVDSLIDDEDYVGQTGSGSGDGDIVESTTSRGNTDIVFIKDKNNIDTVSQSESDGSFNSIRPSLLLLIVVSLLAIGKCH